MKSDRLRSFLRDYGYYRTQQQTVRGLGRWESFWRAVGWSWRRKK